MKTFTPTLFALAAALSITQAAPSTASRASAPKTLKTRQGAWPSFLSCSSGQIPINLLGATDNASQEFQVCIDISVDATCAPTNVECDDSQDLSISYVQYDHNCATCEFYGVNGQPTEVETSVPFLGQLGPPQVITSILCYAS